MEADRLITLGVIAVTAASVLLVLAALKARRAVAAWIVGGAGVLMAAQVGGAHLFTLATMLWLVFTRPTGRSVFRATGLLVAAGGLAVTVLFGDLVNSRSLALQLMALAVTAVAIAMRAEDHDTRAMIRGALAVITFGASVGALQVAGVIPMELWHLDVSSIGRPTGIWPEPDWMGLMAALGLVLAWRLPLSPLVRTAALSLNGLMFVLAFARAAWVALAVSVVLLVVLQFFTSRRAERPVGQRRGGAVAVLLLLCVGLLVASPELRSDLGRRVESLTTSSTEDVSGQARIGQTRALLHLADSAAPFGHGLSASGRVGVTGQLFLRGESVNNVASNWLLAMWVDGALLALPLIGFLLVFALRGARTIPGQMLVVVLVNSLFSNATFMPVAWLALALTLLAVTPRVRPPRPTRPERPTPVELQRRRLAALARTRAPAAADPVPA